MVFQDPMTALNPVLKIGNQITEGLRQHLGVDRKAANENAVALLRSVGIPEPERRLSQYPHELSGGMRQRVMIAIALACGPKLLFADEPTTALDVTVQAQILDLLARQQRERNMAMILVTHDLGVVAGRADDDRGHVRRADRREGADRRAVPQRADAVHRGAAAVDPEAGRAPPAPAAGHPRPPPAPRRPAERVPVRPAARTPRTKCHAEAPPLIESEPGPRVPLLVPARSGEPERQQRPPATRATAPAAVARHHGGGTDGRHRHRPPPPAAETLLRVEDLVVEFPAGRRKVHAVSGVSIDIREGETLGLVGESGCGKSTTGKAIIQLPPPTSGPGALRRPGPRPALGQAPAQGPHPLQMIFQDPISSLNPRRKVRDILAEALRIWERREPKEQDAKVDETLEAVGLDPDARHATRGPTSSPGGQCQRISIARARWCSTRA